MAQTVEGGEGAELALFVRRAGAYGYPTALPLKAGGAREVDEGAGEAAYDGDHLVRTVVDHHPDAQSPGRRRRPSPHRPSGT